MPNKLKVSIRPPLSIREKVYTALRDDILNGKTAPGERLVENQIAKQIKTSRTPVREALHMLEREGILESIPRVGYRVKPLSPAEVGEICEIRAVNETLAARWAMKRISAKAINALQSSIDKAREEIAAGNPKKFVEFDAEFHETLARESGSERLLELCQLLRRHMLRYRIESVYVADNALRALDEHQAILDLIRKKDPEGVEKAIRSHMESSREAVLHYAFKETPERDPSESS